MILFCFCFVFVFVWFVIFGGFVSLKFSFVLMFLGGWFFVCYCFVCFVFFSFLCLLFVVGFFNYCDM